MQHTVIAFFDTYAEAEAARDALVGTGIASAAITLQARCEPTYATDATTIIEHPQADEGLLASIERFFESLFASEPPRHETAQYPEAVRRGAVMLSVDAADDAQCESARAALAARSPIDIEERAATWSAPGNDAMREHSPLEELGIRRRGTTSPRGAVRSFARDEPARAAAGTTADKDIAASEAAAIAVAAGSAPGMGAVFAGRRSEERPRNAGAPAAAAATPPAPTASPSSVPDEYLQDEEHFRGGEQGDGR